MLAVQEEASETPQDRRARKRGLDLLRALSRLQLDFVAGGDEAGSLRMLADLASDLPEASAPQIGAALRSITVRARVELARRGL